MLKDSKAFSGFSVDDIDAAARFYGETLGLDVEVDDMGFLVLHLAGDRPTIAYPKPNHEPATYTVLNFPVPDTVEAVQQLEARGVVIERYEGLTDDDGIARSTDGPLIAWFKDPAGNVLSILETE